MSSKIPSEKTTRKRANSAPAAYSQNEESPSNTGTDNTAGHSLSTSSHDDNDNDNDSRRSASEAVSEHTSSASTGASSLASSESTLSIEQEMAILQAFQPGENGKPNLLSLSELKDKLSSSKGDQPNISDADLSKFLRDEGFTLPTLFPKGESSIAKMLGAGKITPPNDLESKISKQSSISRAQSPGDNRSSSTSSESTPSSEVKSSQSSSSDLSSDITMPQEAEKSTSSSSDVSDLTSSTEVGHTNQASIGAPLTQPKNEATIGSQPGQEAVLGNTGPNIVTIEGPFNMWKPQHETFSSEIDESSDATDRITAAARWYYHTAASCYDDDGSQYKNEYAQFKEYAKDVFRDNFGITDEQDIEGIFSLRAAPAEEVSQDKPNLLQVARQAVMEDLAQLSTTENRKNGEIPNCVNVSSSKGLGSGKISSEGNSFTVNKIRYLDIKHGPKYIGTQLVDASIGMGMFSNPKENVRYTLNGDVANKVDRILDKLDDNEANLSQVRFTLDGRQCNTLEILLEALKTPSHPLYKSIQSDWGVWGFRNDASYNRQAMRLKIQQLIKKRDAQNRQKIHEKPKDLRDFSDTAKVWRTMQTGTPTSTERRAKKLPNDMRKARKDKLASRADPTGSEKSPIVAAFRFSATLMSDYGLTLEEAAKVCSTTSIKSCSSILEKIEKNSINPKDEDNGCLNQDSLKELYANFENRAKLDRILPKKNFLGKNAPTATLEERIEILTDKPFDSIEEALLKEEEELKKTIQSYEDDINKITSTGFFGHNSDERNEKNLIQGKLNTLSQRMQELKKTYSELSRARLHAYSLNIDSLQSGELDAQKKYVNLVYQANIDRLNEIDQQLADLENSDLPEERKTAVRSSLSEEKSYLAKNIDKIDIVKMASLQNKERQHEILKKLTEQELEPQTQEKLDNMRFVDKYGIDVDAENEDKDFITISFPDLKDKNGEPISITMPKEDFNEDEHDFKTKLQKALHNKLAPLSLDETVRQAANKRVQSMLTEGNLSERLRAVATDPLVYTGDKIDGSIELLLEEPGQTNKFATHEAQLKKLDNAMKANQANMRTVAEHHRNMGKRDGANQSTVSEYRKKF